MPKGRIKNIVFAQKKKGEIPKFKLYSGLQNTVLLMII